MTSQLTYGSLFAGIGGFDLGFDRAGMLCKWQVEIDPYCQRVLAKHWPEVRRHDDAKECGRHNLEQIDIIAGGDPCQENSAARQSTGLESPSLGHEFIRIVDECRPAIVVRENPSAVKADAPWPWWRFRSSLESIGYVVLPFRLRACCFGLDHQRDRLFLLAERADAMQARPQRMLFEEVERAIGSKGVCNITGQNRRCPSPRICRGIDGVSNRVDRTKGLGNAVPPPMSEWIGRRIVEAFGEIL